MISNQILQTTVDGLKAISRVDFCVIDADGKVAAKTFEDAQNCIADAIAFMDSPAESQVVNGYQFFKVLDDQNLRIYSFSKRNKRRCVYARKACSISDSESVCGI